MSEYTNDILNTPKYVENTETTLGTDETVESSESTEVDESTSSSDTLNYLDDPEGYLEWFNSEESEVSDYDISDLQSAVVVSNDGTESTGVASDDTSKNSLIGLLGIWLAVAVVSVIVIILLKKNKNKEINYEE